MSKHRKPGLMVSANRNSYSKDAGYNLGSSAKIGETLSEEFAKYRRKKTLLWFIAFFLIIIIDIILVVATINTEEYILNCIIALSLIIIPVLVRIHMRGVYIDLEDYFIKDDYNDLIKTNVENFATSKYLWQITSSSDVIYSRVAAGANSSVGRKLIKKTNKLPEGLFATEEYIGFIIKGNAHMYFMPDFILVNDNNTINITDYRTLDVSYEYSLFREEECFDEEAECVGNVWKYSNNDGSPDRRFADNYCVDIYRYIEITISAEDGFNIQLMCSNHEKGFEFYEFLTDLIEYKKLFD